MKLKDKIAVVTGGNSGIGKAIVKDFIEQGAKVTIMGRNQETLASTRAELGENVLTVCGDVKKLTDIDNLYAQTKKHFGNIDIIVANSGIVRGDYITKVDEACFDDVVSTNYKGSYFTVKNGVPFLNDNGAIVLISSVAAHRAVPNSSLYNSSKAAVSMLAKCFATDLADRGIRVNAISPGFIVTPAWKELAATEPNYQKKFNHFVPLKRFGTVDEIAKLTTFLVSDDASYITATDITADGGLEPFSDYFRHDD